MDVEFTTIRDSGRLFVHKCRTARGKITSIANSRKANVDIDTFKLGQKLIAEPSLFSPTLRYSMKIVINLEDDAVGALYQHLGIVGDDYNHDSSFEVIIDDIFKAPRHPQLYDVRDYTGHVCFAIEINMALDPLQQHIVHPRRGLLTPPPDSVPSLLPSAEEESSNDSLNGERSTGRDDLQASVAFVKEDQVEFVMEDLTCPFDDPYRGPFQTIELLELHLEYSHFNFEFKRTDAPARGQYRFDFQNATAWTRTRPSNSAEEPYDVLVVPSAPRSIQEYLRPRSLGLEKEVLNTFRAKDSSLQWIRKRPKNVLSLRDDTKRKWKVPAAPPNVTYFHTITRRPLQEGEMLSDGDDDVSQAWQSQMKKAELDRDQDIPDTSKRFIEVFDAYLAEENAQCDHKTRDALIRFTRKKADWIYEQGLLQEYKRHIAEFLDDRVINEEYYRHCLDIMNARKPVELSSEPVDAEMVEDEDQEDTADSLLNDFRKSSKRKGKAIPSSNADNRLDDGGDVSMGETAGEVPGIDTDVDPPYDTCICNSDARNNTSPSPLLICSSTVSPPVPAPVRPPIRLENNLEQDCIRRFYHLACIPADQRPEGAGRIARDWTCAECKVLS